ncbi:Clavaminate synthase-like protein [Hymenopellis radicata]|nr:Clavaminate synthase-like protein [Hymenopellis radicata]
MPDEKIAYTPEGVVLVSYPTLVSAPETLGAAIEKAFGSGPECLGIIVVKDLPPAYVAQREKLLTLAYKFAHLAQAQREKYSDESSNYSFGWSHGKEIMNGKPDVLKGSYYANPIIDVPSVSQELAEEWKEYYRPNIWPDPNEQGVEGFEEAFKDLGRFVFDTGCALAEACQPFALSRFSDATMSLPKLISTSQTTKARLLHYFPPSPDTPLHVDEDEPVDSWCGFHLDHSLLTGLCSAMFLREGDAPGAPPTVVPCPSSTSGLYIRNRGGELTKVSIPQDCLAFQTGEALELATGGKLRATPHCVRVGGSSQDISTTSRETFALFMQPGTEELLSPTSVTFGQFSEEYSQTIMERSLHEECNLKIK